MKIDQLLAMAGIAGVLCAGGSRVLAQGGPGGGNFDPAQMQQQFQQMQGGPGGGNPNAAQFQQQMQQMMMNNYRDQLEVTNDDEWIVIKGRIQKVLDARQETGFGGVGGMMGMFGGGRGGGANGGPGGGRGGLGSLFGAPSPEEDALQKALDADASNAQLKAVLAKVVAARKAKQTKLEKAQDELRKVLSVRQEAIASLSGLL